MCDTKKYEFCDNTSSYEFYIFKKGQIKFVFYDYHKVCRFDTLKVSQSLMENVTL